MVSGWKATVVRVALAVSLLAQLAPASQCRRSKCSQAGRPFVALEERPVKRTCPKAAAKSSKPVVAGCTGCRKASAMSCCPSKAKATRTTGSCCQVCPKTAPRQPMSPPTETARESLRPEATMPGSAIVATAGVDVNLGPELSDHPTFLARSGPSQRANLCVWLT